MAKSMNAKISVEFIEAEERENLSSGESLPVLFGKIKKWFLDLKNIAFSGSYQDLEDKPLRGTAEIVVDTDTTKVTKRIDSGTQDHLDNATMSLRIYNIGQNDKSSINSVILPKLRFYKLNYRGSLYVVIESETDDNIPKGTYYVDWVETG